MEGKRCWNRPVPFLREPTKRLTHYFTILHRSCLCKTVVTDSIVFTDISGLSKDLVTSQLFIGALGPAQGSAPTSITPDLTVHMVGGVVDDATVFQVNDKGRTFYLKNVLSTVSLEGWEMVPTVYEAESAARGNAVSFALSISLL